MGVAPNLPFFIGIFHEINIQLYTPPIETSRFGKLRPPGGAVVVLLVHCPEIHF